MAEIYSHDSTLPHIPDDITLANFMLGCQHSLRPARKEVPCLVEDRTGRKIFLDEMRNRTYSLASILRSTYGIGENDVVFISSPNHIDYATVMWSVLMLGGIVSCSNPQFTVGELSRQLEIVGVALIIGHSSNITTVVAAAHLNGLPSNRVIAIDAVISPNSKSSILNVQDLIEVGLKKTTPLQERILSRGEGRRKVALLSWSSGTTGKPKAVAISHYALIANIIQMAAHNQVDKAHRHRKSRGYRPGDVAIGVLPFYHVAGLVISLHFTLFCAMSVVVVEKYNILTMLESIVRHRITHLIVVPPIAVELCKHPAVRNHDLSAVKYLMIGAAPVSRGVQSALWDQFPDAQIGQAYGLTEMTTTLAMIPAVQARSPLGSGGKLLPGVQARIIKADGSVADFGELGELVVRGPAAALYYLNDEQATRDTFTDGWVHTGDQVSMSENFEIFVIDRLKELMKVKGHQVAPAEVESCLLSHPAILDCCVVGIPDDYTGELPMAFVVLAQDAKKRSTTANECEIKSHIIRHVADRMVSYKQLKGGVQLVENIPRNGSGKLLRRQLRDTARTLSLSQGKCFRARM